MSTGQLRRTAARRRQSTAGRPDKKRSREAGHKEEPQRAAPGTMPAPASQPKSMPTAENCDSETKAREQRRSPGPEARAYTRRNSLDRSFRRFRQEEYTNATLALDDSDEPGVVKSALGGFGGSLVRIW